MDVSDVLRDRMQPPVGFQRMVAASVAAHVVFGAAVLFVPRALLGRSSDEPATVMTISISGAGAGPVAGGMTAIGGRAIQEVRPPDEAPKREAVRPPAARTPEMTLPAPNAKPTKASTAAPVKTAPDDARGRTPTKGATARPGSSIAETGNRGQGFGLSTGGGPGTGSTLDVADFCCPEYLALMSDRIRSVWMQNQGATGQVRIKFTIQRDGTLVKPMIERPSGITTLDMAALRAVVATKQLTPLPTQFTNDTLTVYLNFEYR